MQQEHLQKKQTASNTHSSRSESSRDGQNSPSKSPADNRDAAAEPSVSASPAMAQGSVDEASTASGSPAKEKENPEPYTNEKPPVKPVSLAKSSPKAPYPYTKPRALSHLLSAAGPPPEQGRMYHPSPPVYVDDYYRGPRDHYPDPYESDRFYSRNNPYAYPPRRYEPSMNELGPRRFNDAAPYYRDAYYHY